MSIRSWKDVNAKRIEQRNFHLWLRLDAEQEAIGTFTPWMMHSFSEGTAPVGFSSSDAG